MSNEVILMKRYIVFASLLLIALSLPATAQQSTEPQRATQRRTAQTPPSQPAAQPTSTEPEASPRVRQPEQERQQQPARTEPERPETQQGPGGATNTNFHFDMHETAANVTHHEVTVNGRALRYTATAGRLPIKNAEGLTEALMFYVAYTLDGSDSAKRPLTFSYNGGPGSASLWLHIGALGPRTVMMQPDGAMPQPPFRLHDNPYTPLDRTDVVMVDA